MSVFNDDDKELLKNSCEGWPDWGKKIKALIRRLEAAEKALKLWEDEKQISSAKMIDAAMEAWRKSKGAE